MAVRGDDPLKIKQRAGHSTFSTTEGYIREAEAVRDGFGEVFPPLPAGPLGIAPESPRAISVSRKKPKTSGSRWRRRELNPGPKMTPPCIYVRVRQFVSPRFAPAGGLSP